MNRPVFTAEIVRQRVEAWLDLMESTDQLYIAALRSRCDSEEEVWRQYKAAWDYANREHEKTLERMLINLGDGGGVCPRVDDDGGLTDGG
ncbi:MAG: hypothetical protein NT069_09280 [Planctomycetota bacterium]|nr:hypothetical protein [Planctomycetota bacterium]